MPSDILTVKNTLSLLASGKHLMPAVLLAAFIPSLLLCLTTGGEAPSITGRGTLEPVEAARVYVPHDGTLRALNVKEGQQVSKEQHLLTVESPEVMLREASLRAEIDNASKMMDFLQNRLQVPGMRPEEKGRLKGELENQRGQLTLKRKELESWIQVHQQGMMRAPIAGTVVMEPTRGLVGRPVKTGDHLLSIVQFEGTWTAQVRIAEKDVGRLMKALALGQPLTAEVTVAAYPDRVFLGKLHPADVSRKMSGEGKDAALAAEVRLSEESLKELRLLPRGVQVQAVISLTAKP